MKSNGVQNQSENNYLPPKVKKRRIIRSRGPKAPPQWNDGFNVSKGIPEYKAYNDVYAQGYIG